MATPAPVAPPPTTIMSHAPGCAPRRRYISDLVMIQLYRQDTEFSYFPGLLIFPSLRARRGIAHACLRHIPWAEREKSGLGRGVRGSLRFGLSLQPLVGLLLRHFFGNAVALLQATHKLFLASGHEYQVVVGELAPLLPGHALHLHPFTFHLIPIHSLRLALSCGTRLPTVPLSTYPIRAAREGTAKNPLWPLMNADKRG